MTMLTKESLKGFVPAVVTPFDARGAIMEDDFAEIVEHMIRIGADGICVAGDNGESWTLDSAERQRLTRIAVDRAAGRVPVLAGATAPAAAQAVQYATAARDAGASGILVMPQPYVLKATREELLRRFELLTKAVDIPIVLYNSPRRAGIDLSVEDVGALLSAAPIVGIKESSRDMAHLTRLLLTHGDRISVMVGPAYYILAGSALGAAGFISTGPEFLGDKAGRLMRMGRSAPDREYVKTHRQLSILYETLMSLGTWPSALKAGLGLLGLPAGVPRDPVLPLAPAALDRLRSTLEELELLNTGNPARRATA
jgi:4-hydroxy-tetrahydrodipicolinate synthase